MARRKNVRSAAVTRVKKVVDTGFLLSIGLASIAKDNVEKMAGDLVKKGRLNETQGRKVVKELLKKSKKERDRVKKLLRK